jgi:hypothetical protein
MRITGARPLNGLASLAAATFDERLDRSPESRQMQRKLVVSAVVFAVELLIQALKPPLAWTVTAIAAGCLYLLWTWEGLPHWVAKHQEEDRSVTLGDINPTTRPKMREANPGTDLPKPSLELFDGDSAAVVLSNSGVPDEFTGTGRIVKASRGAPKKYPYALRFDNMTSGQKIGAGVGGRVILAQRQYVDGEYRLNIRGDYDTAFATWRLGTVSNPKPVTVVINVTFVSSSFPLVAIDRHYELVAGPKQEMNVSSWVPF